MFSSLKVISQNYDLILIFLLRDISSKFKGSYFGIFWMAITPLFMLAIFTFIFGEIFQIKWLDIPESKDYFSIILFSNLKIFFNDLTTQLFCPDEYDVSIRRSESNTKQSMEVMGFYESQKRYQKVMIQINHQ